MCLQWSAFSLHSDLLSSYACTTSAYEYHVSLGTGKRPNCGKARIHLDICIQIQKCALCVCMGRLMYVVGEDCYVSVETSTYTRIRRRLNTQCLRACSLPITDACSADWRTREKENSKTGRSTSSSDRTQDNKPTPHTAHRGLHRCVPKPSESGSMGSDLRPCRYAKRCPRTRKNDTRKICQRIALSLYGNTRTPYLHAALSVNERTQTPGCSRKHSASYVENENRENRKTRKETGQKGSVARDHKRWCKDAYKSRTMPQKHAIADILLELSFFSFSLALVDVLDLQCPRIVGRPVCLFKHLFDKTPLITAFHQRLQAKEQEIDR